MNVWVEIVIAVFSGGTVGGIVGAFSPILTARLAYRQKIEENRIANARTNMETVYLPINISLSHLAEKYAYYKSCKQSYEDVTKGVEQFSDGEPRYKDLSLALRQLRQRETDGLQKARQDFLLACGAYLELVSTIANQGNDMYIINKFEERLRLFTAFIQTFMAIPVFHEKIPELKAVAGDSVREELDLDRFFTFSAGSPEFTSSFEKDIRDLKLLIKEVSLGG
jgi:hypothetical protein